MESKDEATSWETVAYTGAGTDGDVPAISSVTPTEDEGRFVSGTLLNGRYRIIGLLGRGGMGEVYRATDLTLVQSVALKFLPAEAAGNQRLLERFHAEVRVARQVSHPNVCRVHDIGQAEGIPFISMEYIDGEDLSSLLLRIGRLPAGKAVETARKICAGLSAAHDRGVIHRDLKPHNIMLNKRGEVVIMDFGLAAIADQLSGPEARNGTPAYMAPEQLKGSEVTAKSDLYSLGLVLYELFTGKRPYEGQSVAALLDQQEALQLTSMTSIATDVDPAVENVIRRCLQPDPGARPASALSVAAALPGGDPLAAALAAGQTPSPEIVASSGKTEGLPRKVSVPCLIFCVVCVLGATLIRGRTYALGNSGSDLSPEVLAQKAREIAKTLGWSRKPVDTDGWIYYRGQLLNHLRNLPNPQWIPWMSAESPIQLTYRESQSQLVALPFGRVSDDQPPLQEGMANVYVDGHGYLRALWGFPYEGAEGPPAPVAPEVAFQLSGLDLAKFTEVAPQALPKAPTNQRKAWKGPHPVIPSTDLNVEMGWLKGQVTYFQVRFPWNQPASPSVDGRSTAARVRGIAVTAAASVGLWFVVLFARRNWKLGRTDRKGALRLAIVQFFLACVGWIGEVHPVPNDSMFSFLEQSSGQWLLYAGFTWLLYLALEPAVRSRWPHSLVTWNRVLAGKWLDAQVGGHVLIGAAIGGVLWAILATIEMWVSGYWQAWAGGSLSQTLGTRQWIGLQASLVSNALNLGMVGFFIIFGWKGWLKRDWLAALVAAASFTMFEGNVANAPNWVPIAGVYIVLFVILIFLLLRLGLVPTLAAIFFVNGIGSNVLGTDWKTWYAPYGVATICLLLSVAVFAFWRSLGGRELLGAGAEPGEHPRTRGDIS